jgi:hypothetical protein
MTTKASQTIPSLNEIKANMLEIARIGQAFIDGDLCRNMLRPHAETFAGGDDFDLNPDACVPLKKTMFRLERLSRFVCSTAIWRRRPDMPDRCEPILFGAAGSPGSSDKPPVRNYQPPLLFPELKTALFGGKHAFKRKKISTILHKRMPQPAKDVTGDELLRLFVPIKDSMGNIAAVLEIFSVLAGRKKQEKT